MSVRFRPVSAENTVRVSLRHRANLLAGEIAPQLPNTGEHPVHLRRVTRSGKSYQIASAEIFPANMEEIIQGTKSWVRPVVVAQRIKSGFIGSR